MAKKNTATEEQMPEDTQDEVIAEQPEDRPARRTRTIEVEIADEFAEKPEPQEFETLADQVEAAANLLEKYDFISGVESRKVRKRITKALFGMAPE